ncbi:MAG: DUF6973 domain-containing protein [Bacteroidota bacterium]
MKLAIPLFAFLFSSIHVFSQDSTVRMHNLSKKEKHWAITHPFAAKKAKKIIPFVREDVRVKITEGKLDSLIHGGQADAYRHALWMALTAKHIGEKKALKMGQLHEAKNKEDFYKSIKDDDALQDSISCQMDLLNNALGISYGVGYKDKSDKEIQELILAGINNGEFFILFRNKKNQFMDCEGNVVSKEDRVKNKKWFLPYCLVPSNNTSDTPTR